MANSFHRTVSRLQHRRTLLSERLRKRGSASDEARDTRTHQRTGSHPFLANMGRSSPTPPSDSTTALGLAVSNDFSDRPGRGPWPSPPPTPPPSQPLDEANEGETEEYDSEDAEDSEDEVNEMDSFQAKREQRRRLGISLDLDYWSPTYKTIFSAVPTAYDLEESGMDETIGEAKMLVTRTCKVRFAQDVHKVPRFPWGRPAKDQSDADSLDKLPIAADYDSALENPFDGEDDVSIVYFPNERVKQKLCCPAGPCVPPSYTGLRDYRCCVRSRQLIHLERRRRARLAAERGYAELPRIHFLSHTRSRGSVERVRLHGGIVPWWKRKRNQPSSSQVTGRTRSL